MRTKRLTNSNSNSQNNYFSSLSIIVSVEFYIAAGKPCYSFLCRLIVYDNLRSRFTSPLIYSQSYNQTGPYRFRPIVGELEHGPRLPANARNLGRVYKHKSQDLG